MIKEASFRKFNFHPNRDEVQQQFNRFSNYLTRELRKRHRAEHRSSHRNFHTSSSPRHGLDSDQDSLDVPLELRDLLTNTDQVRNSTTEGRHLRYLEEPQLCYKQNKLKLNLQAGHCPLENAAFSRTYSRPTNHRFLKCFAQDHESPPKRRQGLHFQHKNQPPSQSRSNFNTFNKLLKVRMFRNRDAGRMS